MADLLLKYSRGINVISRWGGDEFAVLLVETTKAGAQLYAERLRQVLAAYPSRTGGRSRPASGSPPCPKTWRPARKTSSRPPTRPSTRRSDPARTESARSRTSQPRPASSPRWNEFEPPAHPAACSSSTTTATSATSCASSSSPAGTTRGWPPTAGGAGGLRRRPAALTVTDVHMPVMDGVELLKKARALDPDAAFLVLTGVANVQTAVESLKFGAFDFIMKPVHMDEILIAAERRAAAPAAPHRAAGAPRTLERKVEEATRELESTLRELENTYRTTLEALGSAIDTRDLGTHAHSRRVRGYSLTLARAHGFPAAGLRDLEHGVLLHDIGKIGIPDAILLKPGPLTPAEWKIMRTHPEIGRQLVEQVPFLRGAVPIVYHHHERWDGTGYPLGLKGDDIPLGARIFARGGRVRRHDLRPPVLPGHPAGGRAARDPAVRGHPLRPARGGDLPPPPARGLRDHPPTVGRVVPPFPDPAPLPIGAESRLPWTRWGRMPQCLATSSSWRRTIPSSAGIWRASSWARPGWRSCSTVAARTEAAARPSRGYRRRSAWHGAALASVHPAGAGRAQLRAHPRGVSAGHASRRRRPAAAED